MSGQSSQKSLSDLVSQRDALTRMILAERFARDERPLAYGAAVIAAELARGNLGASIPQSLRNKAFVWHIIRQLTNRNGGRAPTFAEVLAAIE